MGSAGKKCGLGPQGLPAHQDTKWYSEESQERTDWRLRLEEIGFRLADYSPQAQGPTEGKKPCFLLSPGSWGCTRGPPLC